MTLDQRIQSLFSKMFRMTSVLLTITLLRLLCLDVFLTLQSILLSLQTLLLLQVSLLKFKTLSIVVGIRYIAVIILGVTSSLRSLQHLANPSRFCLHGCLHLPRMALHCALCSRTFCMGYYYHSQYRCCDFYNHSWLFLVKSKNSV
jgi:hypothetical protein